ncbi:MAG TPA: hypothetical protein VFM97_00160 [Gammaproteobacteria bacterium]|nr:hypothetical protein [Gammaproteobacteria bacterium]
MIRWLRRLYRDPPDWLILTILESGLVSLFILFGYCLRWMA